ncbi:hypothetical protein Avbf_14851 [Armadillidium vulgare]|nr:hypothetical protein Avbf_14851 [Armadillidium vulgare]
MRRLTKKFITFTLFLLLIYIIDWSAMLKLAVTFYEGTTKNSSELQNGENILVNRIYPDFHQCSNKESSKRFEQKGQFWGPISVAVYAPGTDFDEAVKTIIHLRNCVSKNVNRLCNFPFIL